MTPVPDALFAHPRLAAVYDALDPDRGDLVVYAALADELGARSVLDVGCGTDRGARGAAARRPPRRGDPGPGPAGLAGVDAPGVGVEHGRPGRGLGAELGEGHRRQPAAGQLPLNHVFAADAAVLTSDSTLRFRKREEMAASLAAAGFTVVDVRDAPDRPGRELVFLARRPPADV